MRRKFRELTWHFRVRPLIPLPTAKQENLNLMADACTPVNNKATPVAAIQLASDHPSHAAAEPQLRLSPPLPPTEEPKRDDTDAEAVEAEARRRVQDRRLAANARAFGVQAG